MSVEIIRRVGRPRKSAEPVAAWAQEVGELLQEWLETNGRNATGATSRSLEVVITKSDDQGDEVLLEGNDNLPFVLGGRGPGKQPPIEDIEDWILAKKSFEIDPGAKSLRSIAWAIATKIKLRGWGRPPPVLDSDAITKLLDFTAPPYLDEMGEIQAQVASDAMVKLLTKDIPNTTEKK